MGGLGIKGWRLRLSVKIINFCPIWPLKSDQDFYSIIFSFSGTGGEFGNLLGSSQYLICATRVDVFTASLLSCSYSSEFSSLL